MAADIFLKIGTIKGESGDDKHKEEIEVLSWSWNVSQAGSMGYGSGGGTGKANFGDLTITHYVDKASPNLMLGCTTGEHVGDATLVQRKAGKGQQEFLIITMKEVFITSVATSAGGEAPTESVTLQPTKIEIEYKPQKPDGSLDAGIFFKYDVKANKAY
jgi:type VI secretion system secreted protein Hcp